MDRATEDFNWYATDDPAAYTTQCSRAGVGSPIPPWSPHRLRPPGCATAGKRRYEVGRWTGRALRRPTRHRYCERRPSSASRPFLVTAALLRPCAALDRALSTIRDRLFHRAPSSTRSRSSGLPTPTAWSPRRPCRSPGRPAGVPQLHSAVGPPCFSVAQTTLFVSIKSYKKPLSCIRNATNSCGLLFSGDV